jgi:hypothetical protein
MLPLVVFILLSLLCFYYISTWFYYVIKSHNTLEKERYSIALASVEIEKHFDCKIKKTATRTTFSMLFLLLSIIWMFFDLTTRC